MKKLKFSIEINTSKERVWDKLWNDESYRTWTAAFIPGSFYEGEFTEGSTILFLSPGRHGLFAVVNKVIPFQAMHFMHFGLVLDGFSQPSTFPDNSIEQYDLLETKSGTLLTVRVNTDEEYIDYFSNTFPRALSILKEISEC